MYQDNLNKIIQKLNNQFRRSQKRLKEDFEIETSLKYKTPSQLKSTKAKINYINKVQNFNIASSPIYNDNFLSLAPFFNIYGDKNQEQGKLFITYIAPASNYDVSIESKVYSLNGKKYKLVNPNLVVLWEEN